MEEGQFPRFPVQSQGQGLGVEVYFFWLSRLGKTIGNWSGAGSPTVYPSTGDVPQKALRGLVWVLGFCPLNPYKTLRRLVRVATRSFAFKIFGPN